jgi:hypothetical protein
VLDRHGFFFACSVQRMLRTLCWHVGSRVVSTSCASLALANATVYRIIINLKSNPWSALSNGSFEISVHYKWPVSAISTCGWLLYIDQCIRQDCIAKPPLEQNSSGEQTTDFLAELLYKQDVHANFHCRYVYAAGTDGGCFCCCSFCLISGGINFFYELKTFQILT